nr:MAG TPA: hypothetical protein [Caudoviricetes sp.]
MATKTTAKKAPPEPAFTKAQLRRAKKYENRRDLITALLQDEEQYTLTQVDKMIQTFMKGKVM